ncbi:MAG: hypothetical protein JRG96_14935 [Deltaproteobacteria bacterium]|nr:hypothetical protein [Deltaproteobacteria bacterium]
MGKKNLLMAKAEGDQESHPLRFRDLDDGEFEQVTPPEETAATTRRMFGVSDTDTGSLGARLLSQVVGGMEALGGGAASAPELNDAAALLEGIAPRDAVEGMLAIQMVTAHSAAMRCLRLASLRGQSYQGAESNINRATKLMRTYTAQIEALSRHRSKARQTMIVKHVHVHEGGQAIVGNVAEGEGERGRS